MAHGLDWSMDWTDLTENTAKWRAVVYTVMNRPVPWEFLDYMRTYQLLKKYSAAWSYCYYYY